MDTAQFGQQIKAKYPQYADIPDAELGQKMLAKYPQYGDLVKTDAPSEATDTFLQGHPVLRAISDFVGVTGLAKGATQAIFLNFTKEGKDTLKMLEEGKITPQQFDDIVGGGLATPKEVIGSAVQTAGTIALAGVSPLTSGKTVVGQGAKTFFQTAGKQALKTGAVVGGMSAAEEYGKGGSAGEIAGAGATGFGFGAALSGGVSLAKGLIAQTPKVMSKLFQSAPEKALAMHFENPAQMGAVQSNLRETPKILESVQGMVRGVREKLTIFYQEGKQKLINEFTGARFGLSRAEAGDIIAVSGQYRFPIPKNMKQLSVKEGLELMANVNHALTKGAAAQSPEGYLLRRVRDALRGKLVTNFGGTGGSVDTFLETYSKKKGVLDAADELVRAYRSGSPKSQTSAIKNLRRVFNEDYDAFVKALDDLGAEAGKKGLLQELAASATRDIFPRVGGQFTPGDILTLLLAPVTSPRSSAFLSRRAGNIVAGKGLAGTTLQIGGRLIKIGGRGAFASEPSGQ